MNKIFIIILLVMMFSPGALSQERTYPCTVTRVRDGDTFECRVLVDPYFKIYQDIAVRIADVNCPEVRGWNKAKGFKSKEYATTVLDHFGPPELRNLQRRSFDRVVADVYLMDQSFKELLINNGGCEEYNK